MKIAIYHNLPSGGAKRALFNYAKGLIEGGHEVDVYAPSSADEEFLDLRPLVRRYHELGFRLLPRSISERSPLRQAIAQYVTARWSLMRHGKAVARQIDAGGYDVAFVHHCRFAQSPYVLRFLATPSVYYCQEARRVSFEYSMRHYTPQSTWLGRLLRLAYLLRLEPLLRRRDIQAARSATLILANSFFSVESIKRAYGRYARVAYLGTDLGALRTSAMTDTTRANAVLSVGALHPSKGHELVIDAVGALPDPDRPIVHVVADRAVPRHGEKLADRAAALGVSLLLHERITDEELVALYSSVRVTVCAAELEPFGYTPIEAMACGTPVVAVREGGYKESVIDGHNGCLVERDRRQLADAIAALLTDDAGWERLSRGALESVDRWSMEQASATLERFLAEVGTAQE